MGQHTAACIHCRTEAALFANYTGKEHDDEVECPQHDVESHQDLVNEREHGLVGHGLGCHYGHEPVAEREKAIGVEGQGCEQPHWHRPPQAAAQRLDNHLRHHQIQVRRHHKEAGVKVLAAQDQGPRHDDGDDGHKVCVRAHPGLWQQGRGRLKSISFVRVESELVEPPRQSEHTDEEHKILRLHRGPIKIQRKHRADECRRQPGPQHHTHTAHRLEQPARLGRRVHILSRICRHPYASCARCPLQLHALLPPALGSLPAVTAPAPDMHANAWP